MGGKAKPDTIHVPLPFDAFVTGILKVDPEKLPATRSAKKVAKKSTKRPAKKAKGG